MTTKSYIDEKLVDYHTFILSRFENGLHIPRTSEEITDWLRATFEDLYSKGREFQFKEDLEAFKNKEALQSHE